MNKLLGLLALLLLVSTKQYSQTHDEYMKDGKAIYNKGEFVIALERFDLAYEYAENETQKEEAGEWKKKTKNKLEKLIGLLPT